METTETTETQEQASQEQALKITQVNAFDTTQAVLDELKADYAALIIAGPDDKDGYKSVKTGLAKCVKMRNQIDNRRKSLKNDVDKVGKSLLAFIEPIETHLEKEKKKIDDAKAKADQEAKLAEEKKFKDRTDQLFKFGASFNGVVYTLGMVFITPSEIQSMSDEFFTETVGKFEAAAKEITDKAKAAKDAEESLAGMDPLKKIISITSSSGETRALQVDSVRKEPGKTTISTTILPKIEGSETEVNNEIAYLSGFRDCQEKIIMFLADKNNQLTRAILLDKVTNLKSK